MKTLFIDTANSKEIVVSLKIDGKEHQIKKELIIHKAQIVLPLIAELLKEHNLKLKDLDAIEVNPGPGSFTGVRVGVSVANALSYALKIPVNGKIFEKDNSLAEPVY